MLDIIHLYIYMPMYIIRISMNVVTSSPLHTYIEWIYIQDIYIHLYNIYI